jgi:hypothetical protein
VIRVKVGDLVEPMATFRSAGRGIGVVVQVVKEKFQSTRIEVVFPSSDLETRRRNKIWLSVKDIRIVSKG